jgi:enoyl-CoA hydratase
MYKNITYEISPENVATITFIREKVLNALNNETTKELEQVIAEIENDNKVRVVIFKGKGRAFVAGADITEFKGRTIAQTKKFSQILQRVLNRIEMLSIPVIAAINGFCLGGGLEIAMACDLRIASTNASFGQPEIKLGLIPGAGGTQRLPRLIGKTLAKELIFLGDRIDANRAYEIGLVNKVVSPEEFETTVEDYAKKLAKGPSFALAQAKEAIDRGTEMSWLDAIQMEASLFSLCQTSPDFDEGVTAFLEKRKPEFK